MSFLNDIFSPAGGLADLSGGADKVFGTKPQIAPFTPIDTGTQVSDAITANSDNFDAITKYLDSVVPGFSDILTQGLGDTSTLLGQGEQLAQGQIPDDVKALAIPALRHRLVLSPAAEIEGRRVEQVLAGLVDQVAAPR